MAYCEICKNYDSEHTDGEPDLMNDRKHRPDLEYHYSATIMNKWQPNYVKYDWSHFLPNTDCMCEQCFNAYDRLGKIKWKCESVAPKV